MSSALMQPNHILNNEKYLLCRPRGGLNDTLCQIEHCWSYAENTNRILIIDAKISAINGKFSDYFEPKFPSDRVIFDLSNEQLAILNKLSCFPRDIQGRIDSYTVTYSDEFTNFVASDTNTLLTFNFHKTYKEQLLVHEQCGGWIRSFFALERLVICEKIRNTVLERLKVLDQEYYGVHVRNTDVKTDYVEFFSKISSEVKDRPLLVCSDDAQVISYARNFFKSQNILVSSNIADNQGQPLHYSTSFHDDTLKRKQVIDSIVDLFALGRSSKLFFSTLMQSGGKTSGFSELALHLSNNKNVIDSLLHIPISQKPKLKWRFRLLAYSQYQIFTRILLKLSK